MDGMRGVQGGLMVALLVVLAPGGLAACGDAPEDRREDVGQDRSPHGAGDMARDTARDEAAEGEPLMVAAVEGLSGPESVRYDPEQDLYLVASFGPRSDEPRDSNGFISRVTPEGEVETLRFIESRPGQPLHMPRGMALAGDTLWVADVDGVHGFHRRDGRALAFVDFTAHEPGFLNDVAVGPEGALYVTDTGRARVYRMADGAAEVAVEDTLTGPPNGITWDAGREAFLLAPWGGGPMIRSWTPESGLREVVSVPGGRFDGIEVMAERIVVASQADSALWVVEDGEPRRAFRVEGAPADIGVDTRRGRVAIPYIARDRVELWRLPGLRSDAESGVSSDGPGER